MSAPRQALDLPLPLIPPRGWRPPSSGRVLWLLLRYGEFRASARFAARILVIRFNYRFRPARCCSNALRDARRTMREFDQIREQQRATDKDK